MPMQETTKTRQVIVVGTPTDKFDIPFDYLAKKFVKVYQEGILLEALVDYDFITTTRIQMLKGEVPEGQTIEIRRETSATARLVSFRDASVLTASDLDISALQSLHLSEEARDSGLWAEYAASVVRERAETAAVTAVTAAQEANSSAESAEGARVVANQSVALIQQLKAPYISLGDYAPGKSLTTYKHYVFYAGEYYHAPSGPYLLTGNWEVDKLKLAVLGDRVLRQELAKHLSASITDFGCQGDGKTNDLPNLLEAISWAQETGGSLFIPPTRAGYYIGGTGEDLIRISRPVRLSGMGFWSWFKVADTVPRTTDVIRIKPDPVFGELGYGFQDFSVRGEQGNGYSEGSEPARHSIHIDLKTPGSFLAYCPFKNLSLFRTGGWSIWLSNTNEAAAGVPADYVNCTPIHYTGGLFASEIENCRISGGIWLQCAGDSLKIIGGSLNGYNGIYYDGVPGAGGFKVESVNLTARGGLLINRALAPAVGKTILESLHADMRPIGVKMFPSYFPTIADTAFIHFAGNTGGAAGSGRINSPTLKECAVVVGGALPVGNPQGLQLVKVGVALNALISDIAFGPDTASPLVISSNARSTSIGYHTILGRTPSASIVDLGSNTRRMVATAQTSSAADMHEFKDRLVRESGASAFSETREIARFFRLESPPSSTDGYFEQVYPATTTGTIKRIWRTARRNASGALDTVTEVLYFAADRLIIPGGAGFGMRDELAGEQRYGCLSSITAANSLPSGTVVTIRGAAFGYPKSYIKTDDGNPGAWVLHTQSGVKRGTTAERPTGLSSAACGLHYLDTSLNANGKPIWWNGNTWVDSLGSAV